ncbi:MAG: hypothetical protein DHS20C01_34990 [marine bacterium B5-7]|nr:MAG: hypothetical protein DHS20C01_34990 [marine bacterium B5-7]
MVIVVLGEQFLSELLTAGQTLAKQRGDALTVLLLSEDGLQPDWYKPADAIDTNQVALETLKADRPDQQITRWLEDNRPDMMAFVYDTHSDDERHLISKQLDPVLIRIRCPVALFNPGRDFRNRETEHPRTLIPYSGDSSSRFAVVTALQVNPNAQLTLIGTGPESKDEADRIARQEEFENSLGDFLDDPRITTRLILADNATDLLVTEAGNYDRIVIGAGKGNTFIRSMLGERIAISLNTIGQRLVNESPTSIVIVREYQGWLGSKISLAMARSETLLPTVTRAERVEIYKEVRRAARPRADFFTMIALSSAIAALGLILNSAAVIIGAMLIAPLMAAIIGMGLAMVHGDFRFLKTSAVATFQGALTAIAVGIVMGFANIDGAMTNEMVARTGPALLDLLIATLSGAAAAYALCRKNVSASLPGVAIAVALVPPLATVGLFLSLAEWSLAYGAFLLFMTNLAAIAFASGVVFTLVGFRPPNVPEEKAGRLLIFRRAFLGAGLLTLVVVTHLTVRSIDSLGEELLEHRIQQTIAEYISKEARGEVHLIDVDIVENTADLIHIIITAASTLDIKNVNFNKVVERLNAASNRDMKVSLVFAPMITQFGHAKDNSQAN